MKTALCTLALMSALAAPAFAAPAPAAPVPEYGVNITTEQAQMVMNAALAEAKRAGAPVGIAIVETNGTLVMYQHMTGASYNTFDSGVGKAKSAAMWRRPTTSWIERAPNIATYPNVVASPGGEMIMMGGKIVGAIGVSGNGTHELNIAKAGVAALN